MVLLTRLGDCCTCVVAIILVPARNSMAQNRLSDYANLMTDTQLFSDTRAYWLTVTPAKPLPPGEPEHLEIEVTRAFKASVLSSGSIEGQVRPPWVKIAISVRGHRELQAPREGGFRSVMQVAEQGSSWDNSVNRIRFGSGYIEVLCPKLRGFGLGSLFMNLAIGWALCFHPDATVHEIKIGDDDYRDRRRQFCERFGFRFDRRTDATGNLLSAPMHVAKLRFGPHPLIESAKNLSAAAGVR